MTGSDDEAHLTRDYPERIEGRAELVGVDTEGRPRYYDPVKRRLAAGYDEKGELAVRWSEGRELGETESLEDIIDEIEEAVGWSELTDRVEELFSAEEPED